jgi:hypothetical protein
MHKQIQTAPAVLALLCGVAGSTAIAQANDTSAAGKMSNRQTMEKMRSMSTTQRAAMFDKMTSGDKMTAMKMTGHDMSKMSQLSTQQKADMFDKMPMDTRMATMKMAMKENKAGKAEK